jgi:succinyl-diaminopimelate desuccinylase
LSSEVKRGIDRDVDKSSQEILNFMIQMLRINSVNPKMGGPGEVERAEFLSSFLNQEGFKVQRIDSPDPETKGKVRPNLFAKLKGRDASKNLWIVSHMDTVPEGSKELWDNDPFDPVVRGGRIFARGASDNGQSLVASIFALRELKNLDVLLPFNVGVALVSDEEFDSRHGVYFLLDGGHFGKRDLVVVEGGSPGGVRLHVAEKHLLWLKFVTRGKQVHASLPSQGLNAHKTGMKLGLALDEELHKKFPKTNGFFPKEKASTFEITKKDANVDNINTIPGIDVFYLDSRVIPEYSLDEVLRSAKRLLRRFQAKNKVKVELEIVEREDAGPSTTAETEICRLMIRSVEQITKRSPKLTGIGGQTVGNIFRRYGIPAVGWGYSEEISTAHQPNEYCEMKNLLAEAKGFAMIPLS